MTRLLTPVVMWAAVITIGEETREELQAWIDKHPELEAVG